MSWLALRTPFYKKHVQNSEFGYCYHLVIVITLTPHQREHIQRLLLSMMRTGVGGLKSFGRKNPIKRGPPRFSYNPKSHLKSIWPSPKDTPGLPLGFSTNTVHLFLLYTNLRRNFRKIIFSFTTFFISRYGSRTTRR